MTIFENDIPQEALWLNRVMADGYSIDNFKIPEMKSYVFFSLAVFFATLFMGEANADDKMAYLDPSLPIDSRVDDLISRMTLEEKISQMTHTSHGIERLNIPDYNWWNECLHGVARSKERVTVFPQPIGLAATFNPEELQKAAGMISDEGRAVYNASVERGNTIDNYTGLTFWTPNINIFRDPRWGRGHETYGEDPYLTSQMGMAMVRGLQGDDPVYLKTSACAKHFAVHSGPEPLRHVFDAIASEKDLKETYLPAFHRLVTEAGVSGVMCAYNSYNGQPCCGNNLFMRKILLHDWKFDGYVTSDCWAVTDFIYGHKTHPDSISAAADAVLHGTDLECGDVYKSLKDAVEAGLITEGQIDLSLKKLLKIKFRLGMFDDAAHNPYSGISRDVLESESHKKQALEMARQSMVLLKNDKGLLPLSPKVKKIALLGPNADNGTTQLGNYNGFPTENITLLNALKAEPGLEVVYAPVSDFTELKDGVNLDMLGDLCKDVDVIIFAGGISPTLEGEEGDAGGLEGFQGGDRTSIALPAIQTAIMERLSDFRKPVVFVCMSGSAISFNWEARNIPAIIQAWYGGQSAGTALADILFGRYNPSGKLPVTFYQSDTDLPPIIDYSMKGRTYRYFDGDVLYPFGYGMGYSKFKYDRLICPETAATGEEVTVSVDVRNMGKRAGDEIVQLYLSHDGSVEGAPLCQLSRFKRVSLAPGEKKTVEFKLTPRDLAAVYESGEILNGAGKVKIYAGGVCPTSPRRFSSGVLASTLELYGDPVEFDY